MRIGVFISFANKNYGLVTRLRRQIDKCEKFTSIVVTETDRSDAKLLSTDKVEKGINQCKYFVPILTEDSINTQWINQEIGYAIAKKKVILPIVQKSLLTGKLLKGWIHSEKDLPYLFNVASPEQGIKDSFRSAYQLLIDYLIRDSQTIIFADLDYSEKNEFKRGKIIYLHGDNRFLVLDGYLYIILNSKVYSEIQKYTGYRDRKVTKEEFYSYPLANSIS